MTGPNEICALQLAQKYTRTGQGSEPRARAGQVTVTLLTPSVLPLRANPSSEAQPAWVYTGPPPPRVGISRSPGPGRPAVLVREAEAGRRKREGADFDGSGGANPPAKRWSAPSHASVKPDPPYPRQETLYRCTIKGKASARPKRPEIILVGHSVLEKEKREKEKRRAWIPRAV